MGDREASGRIGLLGLALGMGVAVVAVENILFSLLTGRPLGFAADVEPITVAIVAAPFLILALLGARSRGPWLVAFAMTLLLWGYVLFEGVRYRWHPDDSGANIGLGLIMIFVAPVLITAAGLVAHVLAQRSKRT